MEKVMKTLMPYSGHCVVYFKHYMCKEVRVFIHMQDSTCASFLEILPSDKIKRTTSIAVYEANDAIMK